MLAISKSMNTGLLLLRQGGTTSQENGSADQILNIVNQAKSSSVSTPKAPAESKPKEAQEGDAKSPGFRNPILANPSKYQQLSAKEIDAFSAQQQQTMGTSNISGYARYAQDFGNEAFRIIERKISGLNAFGKDAIYNGKVVEATTLNNSEKTGWQKEVENAEKLTSMLVGTVTEYNSYYHDINNIDESRQDIDPSVARIINNYIDDERSTIKNFNKPEYTEGRLSMLGDTIGIGHISKRDNGEYKIEPYKVMSKDGKLVAEMKDDGHFVTYNEDGSVLKERSRFEVCAELSDGHDVKWGFGETRFARYATLVYTEDKDLMFY